MKELEATAMLTVLVWSVAILALPVLVATTVLALEILAALLSSRRATCVTGVRPACAVLIPAHDEASGIGRTLASVLSQTTPGDRVLVVADNCSDNTADVARAAGAEAVERIDPERRGKGYALDFGVRKLAQDLPAVVVIVDADCALDAGCLDRLVRDAVASGRPVQAAYVMEAADAGSARSRLAAFLFRLKNVVRPRGLARLGMPCLLTGTGMAFPRGLIRTAPLATGNLVEDMQLGIDLAIAGQPPMFCPSACVRSELPSAQRAAESQRTRWIHGHLTTLVTQSPRLLMAALRWRRSDLLGLALEVSVPPLSLLALAGMLAAAMLTIGWLAGGPGLPAAITAAVGGAGALALLSAWYCFGRLDLPARGLLTVPFELAGRLPILFGFVSHRQGTWVRTARRTTS
jgi:cellulose synthase/poly-beta-1,6-N-acetylglucosamine synthase-like glycosyltransferase